MATKTKKIRLFNDKLINTWETYQKVEEQFIEVNEKYKNTMEYLNSIEEFDKKVFIMFAEYNSLRKVSDETNVNKNIINEIITKIRQDLVEITKKDKN